MVLRNAPAHQLSDQCQRPGAHHRGGEEDERGDARDVEPVAGDNSGGKSPPRHRERARHAARDQGGDHGSVTRHLADLERAHGVAAYPGRGYLVDEESLQVPGTEEAPVEMVAAAAEQHPPLRDAGDNGERGEAEGKHRPARNQLTVEA